MPEGRPVGGPPSVPAGVEVALAGAFTALATGVVAGSALALARLYSPVITLVLAVGAGAATATWLRRRSAPHDPPGGAVGRGRWLAVGGAAVVVAVATAVNLANTSEHLVVDRDPAVYLTQGLWLADHADPGPPGLTGPFAEVGEPLLASGLGYYEPDAPGRDVDLQFFRGLPALMATAGWLGLRVALWAPAVLGAAGLVGVWWLAARLLRPGAAVVVVAALAASLPQMWFSRDAYTEPLTQALLCAGLALLTGARRRPDRALVAGLLLGATLAVRVDALVFVAGLALWALVDHLDDPRGAGGRTARLAAGMAPGALVATLDGATAARQYVSALHVEVAQGVALATLAVAGSAWVAVQRRPVLRALGRLSPHRHWMALAAGLGSLAGGLALWLVRPEVQVAERVSRFERGAELVAALQEAAGHAVRPHRTYDEDSLVRIASYLGPATMAAAVVAGAVLVALAVRGRRRTGAGPLHPWFAPLLVTAGPTLLYLWRSGISPDQIWALRRYLPATVPLVVLLAGWTLDRLWGRRTQAAAGSGGGQRQPGDEPVPFTGRTAQVFAAVLAVAMVVHPVLASAPVAGAEHGVGQREAVHALCDRLGDDAAVLMVGRGDEPRDPLLPVYHVICRIPAAVVPEAHADRLDVDALADQWAAEGRTLWLVASEPGRFPVAWRSRAQVVLDLTFRTLGQKLEGRPSRMIDVRIVRHGTAVG